MFIHSKLQVLNIDFFSKQCIKHRFKFNDIKLFYNSVYFMISQIFILNLQIIKIKFSL